ncbi:hypothetical protein SCHPADRAFT_941424 [Schizopora paradoxa]|uniref:DUF7223 domain-containing protein n=1 Tax=Schizopora paradoxa TaxID=27342 RepID=A0A0H2RRR7_9AGAM|nr:hypothetical protein SCHPADRAFT_941424 [Schizopora paradoxa]
MKPATFLPLLALLYGVQAKNDWSTPCLSGSCSFDIARSNSSMAASLVINGSSSAISDITPAAGWTVLNCSSSTNTQTIQIACTDESKACSHLFQNGAENTIVRLPQGCGAGPFARVAKHSIPANQTLPAKDAAKVKRSDGTTPQVQQLQIDTDFNAAASSGQVVGFTVIASTNPDLSIPNPTKFSDSKSGSTSISFDKSVTLFTDTLSCAGDDNANEDVTLTIGVTGDVDLTASYSFEIAGTVIPPKVSSIGVTVTIDGTFLASLNLDADLTGNLDTGEIALVTVGLPGLSIPDILTIGPEFVLNGEATATLNLNADLTIGVQYELNGLSFTVGSSQSSTPGFAPLDSPVSFSVSPSVTADANLQAHLIPTLSLGVSAFDNSASLFVNLDAGLEVDLNATVGAVVSGSGSATETAEACVDISSPISFNVGADGDFFGIIDDSISFPIFTDSFQIYQKCVTQTASGSLVRGSTPATKATRAAAMPAPGSSPKKRSGPKDRIGDSSVESWTELTGFEHKKRFAAPRKDRRQSSTLFARDFSCPSADDPDFTPLSASSDVPAA